MLGFPRPLLILSGPQGYNEPNTMGVTPASQQLSTVNEQPREEVSFFSHPGGEVEKGKFRAKNGTPYWGRENPPLLDRRRYEHSALLCWHSKVSRRELGRNATPSTQCSKALGYEVQQSYQESLPYVTQLRNVRQG